MPPRRYAGRPIDESFFAGNTVEIARQLIGAELQVGRCAVRIVETEAYTTDAASHAVTKPRQALAMSTTYARVYVYLIYGMHHCLNFTTERDGVGAVLVRAAEPRRGLATMRLRRGVDQTVLLANGPGRLCQALGIDRSFDGEPIGKRIKLFSAEPLPTIGESERIGIRQAQELPWRFFERDSAFVSRKSASPAM